LKDLSEEFRFDKMRSGNPAVYLLKEEFENFLSSPQRVELCDWIARCFRQLEQYHEAASWYETAGQLILGQSENDLDSMEQCSSILQDLRRACMSN
jgi:hypothetical protein